MTLLAHFLGSYFNPADLRIRSRGDLDELNLNLRFKFVSDSSGILQRTKPICKYFQRTTYRVCGVEHTMYVPLLRRHDRQIDKTDLPHRQDRQDTPDRPDQTDRDTTAEHFLLFWADQALATSVLNKPLEPS